MARLFIRVGAVAGFVGVALGVDRRPARLTTAVGWCFTVGGTTAVGIVTPFGGLLFLAGWACLALGNGRV